MKKNNNHNNYLSSKAMLALLRANPQPGFHAKLSKSGKSVVMRMNGAKVILNPHHYNCSGWPTAIPMVKWALNA